ncbi:unnamed protein product [Psylliodes chrysocephalus]|uniref:BED-type domain-containing protein n=1 Tax=Psylliodes chrysocephalus TaxID=3402493 RepID=A0A9P0D9A2_9CUCU|nr:unnamed protein product [Psylliodes chrysocephala]
MGARSSTASYPQASGSIESAHPTKNFFYSEEYQIKFGNSSMLDGKFFKVLHWDGKDHVDASCQLCLPKQKIIKGSVEITTNFIKHLKRLHPSEHKEYIKYKTEKQKNKHTSEISHTTASKKMRQVTLTVKQNLIEELSIL